MEFVVNIPQEKRRLKEMKYRLFVSDTAYAVLDIKNKVVLKKSYSKPETSIGENYEKILELTIEALEDLYSRYSTTEQHHMTIELISESIYLNNLINNYIPVWKGDNCNNRPYQSLLLKLIPLLDRCKIKSQRMGKTESDGLRLIS